MDKTARQILLDLYNAYMRDYLTVEVFSEHNGLTTEQGQILINLARDVTYSPHPES